MNHIEEQLWNYIDGSCSAEEHTAISILIETDETYRVKYDELLKLNSELAAMELDEPSMAFTYNVMETIRTEQAAVPLKAAAINKRLIFGITLFFIAVIGVLLILAISSIKITGFSLSTPKNFTMPDVTLYLSKPLIEGFAFFDVVIALFFFDGYLRRKNTARV